MKDFPVGDGFVAIGDDFVLVSGIERLGSIGILEPGGAFR
jgi:hypothetical protein